MATEYRNRAHSLEDLNALIDSDRIAAAALADATFHHDVNTAISAIVEINAVASARISADTHVVSAKMQIDAEVAATRLMADAQRAIEDYKRYVETLPSAMPSEVVSGMVKQIGDKHMAQLSNQAKASIGAIEQDAQAAIAKLKEIGKSAIEEIHNLSAEISSTVDADATVAAERLRAFRLKTHTLDETVDEAENAAQMIEAAAARSKLQLCEAVQDALEDIHRATDQANQDIRAAAGVATERVSWAREKALGTIRTVVKFHMQ